ncbi:MAG: hypothetical protein QF486_05120 [Candidatus Woesearchaeota archaeon]|jgi:hypothetical protein|nr:hypothetical protein [Candidatus Woesearchaeota archaeon]MDP7198969.1 hypothetical protein [Candidatus Woesearchaeota archaeon]MDP7467349.1 hypothetical protein [Candidatus Woesearchaeota archaeon]MDP7646597.1 hypothetical protein [Candidatus Woesearchaeota archaeon]
MSLNNFIQAYGTVEIIEGERRNIDIMPCAAQKYNRSNGVLAFVRDLFVYIGKDTPENLQPLLDWGYTQGTWRVPHSEDGGEFLDELLAIKAEILSEPPKEGFHPISIEILKRLPPDRRADFRPTYRTY